MPETQVRSLGQEDPLEKAILAIHQYSCLEKFMDRWTWRAIAHGVTKWHNSVTGSNFTGSTENKSKLSSSFYDVWKQLSCPIESSPPQTEQTLLLHLFLTFQSPRLKWQIPDMNISNFWKVREVSGVIHSIQMKVRKTEGTVAKVSVDYSSVSKNQLG